MQAGAVTARSEKISMPDYYISANVRTRDTDSVLRAVREIFAGRGFAPIADTRAAAVVEDDDALPPGTDWYGVVVSGASGCGWVSVYVDDWQDSGLLSCALSEILGVLVLEIWVAENVHWGYTLFDGGVVTDRFADAPDQVADTPDEAAQYAGRADALSTLLVQPPDALRAALETARAQAGEFAGPGVDALAAAVGLPFEHVFTGYDFFFNDDPEDYGPSLEQWAEFRHLAFQNPPGRETLAD